MDHIIENGAASEKSQKESIKHFEFVFAGGRYGNRHF